VIVGDEHIRDVADTALMAAGWRAMESVRPDALFDDPLAADLAGEDGLRNAKALPLGAWVVAIRTVVIDAFLHDAISSGIDTIVNLGAGLDTRPYRMDLPPSLRWIEVDQPSVIERKAARLPDEAPRCSVGRVGLDLVDRDARRELFDRVSETSTGVLALAEGLLGYLSADEAGGLADDLRVRLRCELWVTDYLSPRLIAVYRKRSPLRNVPVRFDPVTWEAFMVEHGWRVREIRYLGVESGRLGRPVPLSFVDKVIRVFTSRPLRDMGCAVLDRIA
jgi:methyltransferase (TIGR00027 family)